MSETHTSQDDVPTVLTLKVSERDKPTVAAVMRATHLTNTSELIRFCMGAALRELGVDPRTHQPIEPR
jgi:hypothetical protein